MKFERESMIRNIERTSSFFNDLDNKDKQTNKTKWDVVRNIKLNFFKS
jgi:hypothetical protein